MANVSGFSLDFGCLAFSFFPIVFLVRLMKSSIPAVKIAVVAMAVAPMDAVIVQKNLVDAPTKDAVNNPIIFLSFC